MGPTWLVVSGWWSSKWLVALLGVHTVTDPHVPDHIPLHQLIDDVHPVQDAAKHRVACVEMRLRRVRDEELAAAGVLPIEGHATVPRRYGS